MSVEEVQLIFRSVSWIFFPIDAKLGVQSRWPEREEAEDEEEPLVT